MSLQARQAYGVPETTAQVARSIFPDGGPVMRMLDELHVIVEDRDFAGIGNSTSRRPRRGSRQCSGLISVALILCKIDPQAVEPGSRCFVTTRFAFLSPEISE